MTVTYRDARPSDAATCIDLRGRTRQNAFSAEQLAALGITAESWAEATAAGAVVGRIAEADGQVVGYGFVDPEGGEVMVMALLPEWEGQGIGRRLLDDIVAVAHAAGQRRLVLACSADPASRSHGFYRHLGWQPTGEIDEAGDEILELLR